MKEFAADLHYHGLYSGGVSKNMLLPKIAEQSQLKGLNLIGSSDILHGKWLAHAKENLVEEENGIFKQKDFNVNVILQTEVQCIDRIHHIILFPDFNSVEQVKTKVKGFSNDIDSFGGGRPRIRLNAKQLSEIVLDANAMIGPAHAFTPYFGLYGHFDSLQQCYGEFTEKISFMELGLSADTHFADLMKQNHSLSFLTCSDSHSPWPYRIGREFIRVKLAKPSFGELKKAFKEKEEKRITLNAGLNPREGKYHCTACNNCFKKIELSDAVKLKWRCPFCKGTIKRGVRDRIFMLADFQEETHPSFRPPYLHLLPLAEIIQLTLGLKQITSDSVQNPWLKFVKAFGTEINVLIDASIEELQKVDLEIAKSIEAFRKGFVLYIPGGGGEYGKPIICRDEKEFEAKKTELKKQLECKSEFSGQKTLGEF